MEALDVLVLSPVFKTGVGCEEHPGQVRFLCASAELSNDFIILVVGPLRVAAVLPWFCLVEA